VEAKIVRKSPISRSLRRVLRVEDKFGRRRPMFLPIYHGQTYCRISIERLAMRKGSLICVPSLRRLYLPGASFKLGFMPVSPRSTAKHSFHFRHYGQTSFRILLCVCIFTSLLPQKHGQTSFRIRPIFSSTRKCEWKISLAVMTKLSSGLLPLVKINDWPLCANKVGRVASAQSTFPVGLRESNP
jgi:hypothetical protein